jgi:hypothetical protein
MCIASSVQKEDAIHVSAVQSSGKNMEKAIGTLSELAHNDLGYLQLPLNWNHNFD